MGEPGRVGDLEIAQDLSQEHREWRIERAGWIAGALLLLAALLGLLGPGPLSSATAGEPHSSLWVEYERFQRYQAPATIRVHFGPGVARGGEARVALNRAFVESVDLRHIDPAPARVEAGSDRFTYAFLVADSSRPSAVTFRFEPDTFGRVPVEVEAEGGPRLRFRLFYYP